MRKNRNTVSRNKLPFFFDIAVAVLCCCSALLCVYYFRQDVNQTLSRQNEQPVGIVTYKYKAVQRRFIDRLLWDRVRRESPVYDGDFIRTEDLSEATVFFNGGGVVDLAENSLIQIFARDTAPRLQVSEGGVSVNAQSSDFVVSSGGNTVKVDSGGVVSTRTDSEGKLGLWVSEGRALVSSPEGVREAEAGQALSLARDGRAESIPMTAVLSPRPGARLISRRQSGLAVEFSFNPVNYNGERTRLEISASRNFEEKFLSRNLEENRLTAELAPGVWWWRAYPVTDNQTEVPAAAASGKLTVIYTQAPALLSPAGGQTIVYKTGLPSVRYRWSEAEGEGVPQYYTLELADNPAMDNPAVSARIQGSSVADTAPGAGQWYWRVTPVFSPEYQGEPAASAVSSFVIEQHDELPAPVLGSPAEGSVISLAGGRDDLWFSWKAPAGMDSYTFRISENADLSNPVISAAVKSGYYIYGAGDTALKEGRYYWGVYGTGEAGESRLSSVRAFDAEAGLSPVFPPDNHSVEERRVADLSFTWKGNAGRLQISGGPEFSSLTVNDSVSGSSHRIGGLDAGVWYWRLTAGGEESAARRLSVTVPPPPAPVIVQPELEPPPAPVVVRPEPEPPPAPVIVRPEPEPPPPPVVVQPEPEPPPAPVIVQPEPEPPPAPVVVQPEPEPPPAPVVIQPEPPPPAVEPDPPAPAEFAPADKFVFGPGYFREKQSITFTWPASADGYTFTLRRASGGQIISSAAAANSFRLEDMKILSRGLFVWQVTGNDGKRLGERRFSINIPAVKRYVLRNLEAVTATRQNDGRLTRRITWIEDENASLFELVVEKREDSGYQEVFRKASRNAYDDVPVEPGFYRFRVRIYNLLGQVEHETNWTTFRVPEQ